MKRLAMATLTGCVLLSAPCSSAGQADAAARPDAAFRSAWERLPERAGWRLLVSPGFPRVWPPGRGEDAAVVRYAFAMRLRPGLADGVEVAAPWARSTETSLGELTVEVLQDRLDPIGIQGVRPMGAGEGRLAEREREVADLLLAGGERAQSDPVRDATCGWIGRQGVIAGAIAPLHDAFLRWLACGPGRRTGE